MERRRDAVAAAAVFAAGFTYLYLFHQLGWFMEDEGVLYYHYLRVYQGLVPYRDFFTGYGPLIYYVHAAAFAVLGVSINAVRILTAVVNATTATGLYLVSRRFVPPVWAVAPALLFLVLQPGDIAVMVFHNSPYPSWWALAFSVWGTWALLRWLESRPPHPAWLVLVGYLGGLVLCSKQNAGIFFLWGVTGFLASLPAPGAEDGGAELGVARSLRAGYLALIPLSCLLLVRSYLATATLAAFVVPAAGLALCGVRRRLDRTAWVSVLGDIVWVSVGVVLATAPWLVYFGHAMGVGPFLRSVFFVGADVERNLYVPFPALETPTVLVLVPLALWCGLQWWERRSAGPAPAGVMSWQRAGRRVLAGLIAAGGLGLALWHRPTLTRAVKLEYNLWQIYSFVSDSLDNVVAYLSVGVLWLGLAAVWSLRHGVGRDTAATASGGMGFAAPQTGGGTPAPPGTAVAFLAVLWIAACSFVLFYPRMDYAHLYGATPLLSIVGVALLGRGTDRTTRVALPRRQVRRRVALLAAVVLLAVVGLKSAPKVYSRVMVQRSAAGARLVATPVEWLAFPRARLYFPIYLERQRVHVAAVRDLVRYVQDTTPRDAPVFAFPALAMLYFLSEHDNPTRHDYFLGDNVGLSEQLDVIRTLEQREVPVVVTLNDPTDYFVEKSADATQVLRDYIATRYYRERRIGPYDVWRRYGSRTPRAAAIAAQRRPGRTTASLVTRRVRIDASVAEAIGNVVAPQVWLLPQVANRLDVQYHCAHIGRRISDRLWPRHHDVGRCLRQYVHRVVLLVSG